MSWDLNLQSLKYFVRIAELGSFTRAATHLYIAQPALSRHIGRLETELGTALFHRLPTGVRLTEAGERLLDNARRILSDAERTRDELRAMAGAAAGRIVLGVPPTICPVFVPPLIERLRGQFAGITVKVIEGFSAQLQDLLLEGEIDCAIMSDPSPQQLLACEKLLQEEIVLVTAPGARGTKTVSTAELNALPLTMSEPMRMIVEPLLERRGYRLKVELELNSIETIRIMVRRGLTATILPHSIVAAECKSGILQSNRIDRSGAFRGLVFARRVQQQPTSVSDNLRVCIKAVAADLVASGIFAHSRVDEPRPTDDAARLRLVR